MSSSTFEFSELENIRQRFNDIGIKSGLEDTNEDLLQAGFNSGFMRGSSLQFEYGYLRGLSTGVLLANMLLSLNTAQSSDTPSGDNDTTQLTGVEQRLNTAPVIPSKLKQSRVFTSLTQPSSLPSHPIHFNLIGYDHIMYILAVYTYFSKCLGAKRHLPPPPTKVDPTHDGIATLFTYINTLPTARSDVAFAKLEPRATPTLVELAPSLCTALHAIHTLSTRHAEDPTSFLFPHINNYDQFLSNLQSHLRQFCLSNLVQRFKKHCDALHHTYTQEGDQLLRHLSAPRHDSSTGNDLSPTLATPDSRQCNNGDDDDGEESSSGDYHHQYTLDGFM